MNYNFLNRLILRSPYYSYQHYSLRAISDVIQTPSFQTALFLASADLYALLESKQFEYQALSERERLALLRYYNRMCFRPTPFGSFSSFSTVSWGEGGTIKLDNQHPSLHLNIDQEVVSQLAGTLMEIDLSKDYYSCNPTLYQSGKDFRFITTTYSTDKSKIYFDLQSMESNALIAELLKTYATGYVQGTQILAEMERIWGCDRSTAYDYLQFLAGAQIFIPKTTNNIIGADYLERLLNLESESLNKSLLKSVLRRLKSPRIDRVEYLKSIKSSINAFLNSSGRQTAPQIFYAGLELGVFSGALDQKYKDKISDGMRALSLLVTSSQPPMLEQFIRDFSQKYDKRKIPLLQALDPDIGIGYGPILNPAAITDLLRDIRFKKQQETKVSMEWSKTHQLLLRKWNENPLQTDPIQLDDADLQVLSPGETLTTPPSFSALFRVIEGGLFLETAGGATATALIGRFTAWSEEIHQVSQELAASEELANPNVIFADIGQLSDPHADNINRRKHSYAHEIAINVTSTLGPDQQITLNDLWVSIKDDKLILESKKHQKTIIPRLTSAFNYSRNSLALFRMLCDLQFQDIQGSYDFSLAHYFPGMAHYPKVMYKQTILSPGTWHLSDRDVREITRSSPENAITKWNALREQLKLPSVVAISKSDQQLVFHLDKKDEVLFLIDCLEGTKQVLLQEYYLPDENTVRDQKGNALVNQFIASIYQNQVVYPGAEASAPPAAHHKSKSDYIIGSQWLYLKLYCSPAIANHMLTKKLLPLLAQLDKTDLRSWFFIRYRDSGYHIRLRLHIAETAVGPILLKLKKRLSESIHYHLIREYQADTYRREMDRYGADMILLIETFFHGSSELILRYIKVSGLKSFRYSYHSLAFVSIHHLVSSFIPQITDRIAFLEQMVSLFYAEFATDKSLKIDLDQKYRQLKTEIALLLGDEQYYVKLKLALWADFFSEKVQAILKRAATFQAKRRNQLLADMIHMHLNRLFVDRQRNQELIIYYCLLKYEVTLNAINKKQT
ncbi:thiopeptide-type bacteriocin biosynthesis domain-containing protein [Mucilaginibacter lappiensis]|uniref:Thiopeptide-type bacteriocin biosynthesis protein n=1 Tax=Mucilaginibacter lappiensis TaxID=354630 RepID=A0ABR6PDB5_9SPHI|nr:lantibiotic dehydratase [Mucilaginibacter lappiensis]MBB6107753.1 thiopeptide-type bacteriocin biosynthesis protein [Mucilaginibacter lappiensis]SIP98203.1 thiopeptide-type bacteriocin biosynthesis domain-containing protein [Mucilaginibacter lappiensis]